MINSTRDFIIYFYPVYFIFIIYFGMMIDTSFALTQFYFSIPDVVQDLQGIKFTVIPSDGNMDVVSWTNNGTIFLPDNKTSATIPNYDNLHLDNNDFLLAIKQNIDIGTRLYMCIDLPYPFDQYECQWDAVDKRNTGFAEFDFYFQSHKDFKR
jgi:hypothetical protein